MRELLTTDPYQVTEDNDDITAGEDAIKFDLAYIVGKKDTWCQTTESARNKSREPDIDHSINYENTTQADQMRQAAEDLVNQQTITQYASHCQKCGNVRSEAEHHSMCWQCWYRISENNGRAEQAIDEINKTSSIDGYQISATDRHIT